ncbi:MAG: TIGR01212 family radical SAM protein [Deltaproteobacteria bacterium]|nr:TIGR01212 family radical SAM protein [Deltaproteobacteria bacterium]
MKRYRDYNTYLRKIFGERVQKIPIDAGLGCPNRDGTISREGCIFCDRRGSGTGAMTEQGLSVHEQVVRGRRFAEQRYGARKFIAYFQAFTNTYGPVVKLKDLYDEALEHRGMVGLSVGTRPDCVDRDVAALLSEYGKRYLVWIEYGLQSAHDITLSRINRGHDVAAFEKGVFLADQYGLNVCAHVILGLPGEDKDMMMDTARFLASMPVRGVKIHGLYVCKGTRLATLYEQGAYRALEREEYVDLVVDFLERLPPEMVIQRLTGDPVPGELIAPRWAVKKMENLDLIRKRLEERDTWQGKRYRKSIAWTS